MANLVKVFGVTALSWWLASVVLDLGLRASSVLYRPLSIVTVKLHGGSEIRGELGRMWDGTRTIETSSGKTMLGNKTVLSITYDGDKPRDFHPSHLVLPISIIVAIVLAFIPLFFWTRVYRQQRVDRSTYTEAPH